MHWCRWLIICLVLSALLEPVKAQESTRIALIKEGQDGDYPQLCVMLAEMTCVALDPYGVYGDLTWSPDGRYVAFSASGDLVFLDTRQMKVHWVTRGAQQIFFSWLPDSHHLVYRHNYGPLFTYDVRNQEQAALEATSEVLNHAVSPDGSRVIYTTNDPYTALIQSDGTQRITLAEETALGFAWAPDGQSIAVAVHLQGSTNDLYLFNADGSMRQRLISIGEQIREPGWSPDGNWITFRADPWNTLYVINANGSSPIRINSNIESFAWSSGGHALAYVDSSSHLYFWQPEDSGSQRISVENADMPVWSPDGSRFLFTTVPFFSAIEPMPPLVTLYVVSRTDLSVRPLTSYRVDLYVSMYPRWSSDGEFIIYVSNVNRTITNTIYQIGADGSDPIEVLSLEDILRDVECYFEGD